MAKKGDIRQRLVAKFRGIARERIAAIGGAFEALCGQSGAADTADAMMREIHTLKGEARIMGFGEINDIAHVTEDLLAWARERGFEVSAEVSDRITWGLDLVAQHLDEEVDAGGPELTGRRQAFFEAARQVLAGEPLSGDFAAGGAGAGGVAGEAGATARADETGHTAHPRGGAPSVIESGSESMRPGAQENDGDAAGAGGRTGDAAGAGGCTGDAAAADGRTGDAAGAGGPTGGTALTPGQGASTASTLRQDASTASTVGTSTASTLRRGATASSRQAASGLGGGLGDVVRVHGQTIAQLTRLTGELIIHHETITRYIQSLWSVRAEASTPGGGQKLADTLRRLRDEGFEASLRLEELEDVVRRLRLLDVGVLFERYPPAIRELARERKKKVRVVLDQSDVAVDKQVLDLIDSSVLHLVRNSIDHGIETVAERRAAGKPEQGTIILAARQHGPRVEIEIRDDGRGMSPDRLRRAAAQRGLMSADEARALDDDAALALIFRPGFSTRTEVTDVSGRGVGLDVVSDQVRALGGAIRLATDAGRGTAFTLDLPVSIALLRVLCVRSGAAIFGLPAAAVERAVRVPAAAIERAGQGFAIEIEGSRVPVVDFRRESSAALGKGRGEIEIVVIEHGGARIGLCVDAFVGKRQVVQHSLGAFLSGLSLVSGTALLEEGKVAVLLSVPEIVRRFGEGDARLVHALPEVAAAMTQWRVLVVDDSELTRDMLVGLARRARLTVAEAVNGRDALSKIRAQPPDLILTDLDMPVMNGFQLIAAVRADRDHRDIPIIVLSTRGSDHDKRRALSAGASAYLVKSEFNEESLHGAIRRFLDLGEREGMSP